MTARYPSGYKFTAIVHVDAHNVSHNLPTCQSLGGAPTAAEPMCYDADSLVITKSSKTISVSGLGLENGNIAFG